MINDLWEVGIRELFGNSSLEKEDNLFCKDEEIACRKIDKSGMTRRPKVGTPSIHLGKCRYYIAKVATDTVPPIRNFLCADQIIDSKKILPWKFRINISKDWDFAETFSSKKHLPFDSIPHTMELFQNYIIMGFESSIYAISLGIFDEIVNDFK